MFGNETQQTCTPPLWLQCAYPSTSVVFDSPLPPPLQPQHIGPRPNKPHHFSGNSKPKPPPSHPSKPLQKLWANPTASHPPHRRPLSNCSVRASNARRPRSSDEALPPRPDQTPPIPCPAPPTPSFPIASVRMCMSAPSHSRPTRRPSRIMRAGSSLKGARDLCEK